MTQKSARWRSSSREGPHEKIELSSQGKLKRTCGLKFWNVRFHSQHVKTDVELRVLPSIHLSEYTDAVRHLFLTSSEQIRELIWGSHSGRFLQLTEWSLPAEKRLVWTFHGVELDDTAGMGATVQVRCRLGWKEHDFGHLFVGRTTNSTECYGHAEIDVRK